MTEKEKFADACRASANVLSSAFDGGWRVFIEDEDSDVHGTYADQQRLRVFTVYWLHRLSEHGDDDTFFDPETFGAVIEAKKTLPKLDGAVSKSHVPSTTLKDDK